MEVKYLFAIKQYKMTGKHVTKGLYIYIRSVQILDLYIYKLRTFLGACIYICRIIGHYQYICIVYRWHKGHIYKETLDISNFKLNVGLATPLNRF